jgi:hypothetical protein
MPEKGPPVFLDYDQAGLDAAYLIKRTYREVDATT